MKASGKEKLLVPDNGIFFIISIFFESSVEFVTS